MRWPFRRARSQSDRHAEMQAHLEMYAETLEAQGRSPDEARRLAQLRFGNTRVKLEEIDQMTRLPLIDTLGRDVRYAIRVLRRTPAFTLTAVLTLGLVIGANTAVFSLADAILLTPPPYPEPDRLGFVVARIDDAGGSRENLAQDAWSWELVRDGVPSMDAAVYSGMVDGVNLFVGETAAFAEQQRVGAGYFRVLGVPPAIGREFLPDEDVPGGPALAVLSHRLWRSQFGSDAGIVGDTIRLRGEPYEVVGVMPESFDEAAEADVWTPLRPSRTGEGGGANFVVIGRLRPGADWPQADAELRQLGGDWVRNRVRDATGVTGLFFTRSMQDVQREASREPIVMLGAATAMVLLIACVNIAALLLGRGAGRSKEIATRMALGCGRRAVVRQLMVESLVLGAAGGALGMFVAWVGLAALQQVGASTFQVWTAAAINGRVLLATAGLALLTSILFGLVPAYQASRMNPQQALADGGSRGVAGGARRWPGRALVVSEVALGVTLLIVTGLLVRTFVNLRSLEPGFDPDGLMAASVSLQDARYQTPEDVNRLIGGSLRELRAMPEVENAAVSLQAPYTRLLNWGFQFTDTAAGTGSMTNVSYVSDEFFSTYGIPLREGRVLDAEDRPETTPAVVVNDTFARVFSPDRPIVGRRIGMSGAEREVVGVVGDVQQTDSGIDFEGRVAGPLITTPIVYLPVTQAPAAFLNGVHTWFRPVWAVRPRANASVAGLITQAIGRIDPLIPVGGDESVRATMGRATAEQRLMMTLVGVLAAVALLLAALGIHGLIAHAVAARRREFAIRLALGASAPATIGRVAASGLVLAGLGAVVGGVLSIWAVGLVQSFLWSVGQRDPATYVGVAVFFMAVALVASVLPALRILRLDPAETLR